MKILLAIDGSPFSDAAVQEVAKRPWPPQSEVRVITVDPPLSGGFLRGESRSVFDELVRQQREEAMRRLEVAAVSLKCNHDLLVAPLLLEGRPSEVILDEAERWGADLIVVGSRGHGMLRRLFLGSVSLAVATQAPCSVLIVRPPAERKQSGAASSAATT